MRLGMRCGNAGPDVLGEIGHTINIRNSREQTEINYGTAVRYWIRGARLVVLDVCSIGNDCRADPGQLIKQSPLICCAAQVDPISIAVGAELITPQLAPVHLSV